MARETLAWRTTDQNIQVVAPKAYVAKERLALYPSHVRNKRLQTDVVFIGLGGQPVIVDRGQNPEALRYKAK